MVVRASSAPAFTPQDRARVAIAHDGTLAAIHEPARVTMLELPGAIAFAELAVDPAALANDVAWVGAPPRLLVLSRYADHSTVFLVDPYGPRTIAETRLEQPMNLCATVGAHALAVGAHGAAVLTAGDTQLQAHAFPARSLPATAGAAGGLFVVALAGTVEEWDPQSRMPKRRIKLARPGAIRAVGGSDRVVWWTTQGEPARIDVSPLVNRGQPKSHELPEPIASVSAHPNSDLLACIGADSGKLYLVDLDGRSGTRVIAAEGLDRVESAGLVVGRVVGLVAAQAKRQIAVVSLDGQSEPLQDPITLAVPMVPRELSRPTAERDDRASWRDAVVAWAREVTREGAKRDAPEAPPIAALVARHELPDQLRRAIALLYGAHLAGEPGAAPVDVAHVCGGRWDEALGRGQLVARGLAFVRDSRVRLELVVQRALDELPPRTGALVGTPGAIALLGPCVVVAPEGALAAIAEACLPSVGGALLAAHAGADVDELYREARAYGAVPMLRASQTEEVPAGEPVVLVTADETFADRLGVPRLR